MTARKKSDTFYQNNTHWCVFLLAAGIATAVFLPFLIINRGYFLLSGDFNVQQISFYKLAHEAVRSGDIFWNWKTDLGVNFIGSYSFYLVGSPFFWLTLPFPTSFVPHLMAPLLVLKTAFAAFTSYFYIKRFVSDKYYAMLGSILYAFSGWMSFNLFFNHFHEVAVFFPLLLLAVEKLVTEDKIGWVAVAVAVNAMVNYWFFIGEVIFVILYVIVRTYGRGWRMTWRKFAQLAVESVLGFVGASVLLLPSVLTLMGNPRTGTDRLMSGWGLWIYPHGTSRDDIYPQRFLAIIHSFFFPPDPPSNPNFFPDHGAKWASLSGWIPLFGLTGIFAYFNQKKREKDWVRKLLGVCLLFALVPGLNSLFILLNNSYYARWFYMPILIMALATARAVEESKSDQKSFRVAIKWVAIITTATMAVIGLTPNKVKGEWTIGLAENLPLAWGWYGVVAVGLVFLGILLFRFRFHREFKTYLIAGLAVIILGFNTAYIMNIQISASRAERFIDSTIKGREQITLPEEPFARTDVFDDTDNLMMFWGRPTIQAFHSVVPVSILEFYPSVGVTRNVGSRPEPKYYALRSLLSVRWLFIQQSKEEQSPMPGYYLYDQQLDYNVYENEYYLPMGFTYDYYISEYEYSKVHADSRGNLLLQGIQLDDAAIKRHEDILDSLATVRTDALDEHQYFIDAKARAKKTATDFTIDNRGFSAKTDFLEDELVFFSVPFEGGWSAEVNGIPVDIEKANIGFMAVRVPAGDADIRFNFMTPGLLPGLVLTVGSALLLGGVLFLTRKKRRAQSEALAVEYQWFLTSGIRLSWDEYLKRYNKKQRFELQERLTNRSTAPEIDYHAPEIRKLLSLDPEDSQELSTEKENSVENFSETGKVPSEEEENHD